ncbi:S-ribosylhomocysteine lyase [Staphylococcus simulans]|uniref:S-ribosylhomocysteine lyase n=1 Tax=Staphylococcus simulans TaxID=1286 RepID=UPI001E631827|nr:S-ribosylhomocysteine lyase [Staphylococcus simulans]MCD8916210.1 S-ribosylhomocysteine lyase [Staphylococcus simulans]
MPKMNVESFNLDHTKVVAPFVRLAGTKEGQSGDVIKKYDIRFKQPNKEHMKMPGIHSLEHLMAENIRNHTDKVVDLSPMGCQTGFYVSFINHDDYEDVLNIIEATLKDAVAATEVPADNEVQCGWAASHSLEDAQKIAKEMLEKRDQWDKIFSE